jgi:hypothetical protein
MEKYIDTDELKMIVLSLSSTFGCSASLDVTVWKMDHREDAHGYFQVYIPNSNQMWWRFDTIFDMHLFASKYEILLQKFELFKAA